MKFLQLAAESEQFEQQLDFLLKELASWLTPRSPEIKGAYITIIEGVLSFVVIPNQVKYDADFDDQLATLDYNIAHDQDLNLIRLNTLLVPPVEGHALAQFLHEDFALEYQNAERS
jgi:hypothetical protein